MFRTLLLAASLLVAALLPGGASAQTAPEPTPEQRAMIERIVREYLIANPQVLREAFEALEAREREGQAAQQAELVQRNAERIFRSPRTAVLGNPNGDVTIVEFFDYNCGFCKRALSDMQELTRTDPNLRWVLREFPVLGQGSVEAAQISAQLVGNPRFAEFHRRLLGTTERVDRARALAVARQVGLDAAALERGMNQDTTRQVISESVDLATALGLGGTPTYVIGTEIVVGAVGLEPLRERIANMRRCGRTSCG